MSWLSNFLKHIEADVKPVIAPVAAALAPSLEADVAQAIQDQHLNVLKAVASGLDSAGVPEPVASLAMNLVGNALDQVQVKIVAAATGAPPQSAPPLVAALVDKMDAQAAAGARPDDPTAEEEPTSPPLTQGDGGTAV